MPVTLDTDTIRLITLFENLTGAGVKDCLIENGSVYLVIDDGEIGKAIGRNGNSVKNAERLIKKSVKIFEFSSDVEKFVKNLIPCVTATKLKNENGRNILELSVERNDKPMVIGRDGKNLKIYKELLQRNHNINEIIIR